MKGSWLLIVALFVFSAEGLHSLIDVENSENIIVGTPIEIYPKQKVVQGELGGDKIYVISELQNQPVSDLEVDNFVFTGQDFNGAIDTLGHKYPQVFSGEYVVNSFLIVFDPVKKGVKTSSSSAKIIFQQRIIGVTYQATKYDQGNFDSPALDLPNQGLWEAGADYHHLDGLECGDLMYIKGTEQNVLHVTLNAKKEGFDVIRVITTSDQTPTELSNGNDGLDFNKLADGNVVPVAYAGDVRDGLYEQLGVASIITERFGYITEGEFLVDSIIEPGNDWEKNEEEVSSEGEIMKLTSDLCINSYLVIRDVPQPKGTNHKICLKGYIDFGDPIIGIVWNGRLSPANGFKTTSKIGICPYSLEDSALGWMGLDKGDKLYIDGEDHPNRLYFSLDIDRSMDSFRVITGRSISGNLIYPPPPEVPAVCGELRSSWNAVESDVVCVQEGILEDDWNVHVVLESKDVEVTANSFMVDVITPGGEFNYTGPSFGSSPVWFPYSGKFNSWLITVDSKNSDDTIIDASVEFYGYIVALVWTDSRNGDSFAQTNPIFGRSSVTYPALGGLDPKVDSLSISLSSPSKLDITSLVECKGFDMIRVITSCDSFPNSWCEKLVDSAPPQGFLANPPTDLRCTKYETSEPIWIREKTITLADDFETFINTIPKGTVVTSYLLHVDIPYPDVDTVIETTTEANLGGTILGYAISQEDLNRSAAIFGLDGVLYETKGAGIEAPDSISAIITAGTVSVSVSTGKALDNIRVFVKCTGFTPEGSFP
eukprot:TRINITY_DN19971_c0_g1_i1.p1 TRINITY_DN19971_c0_g1~~TRINITY_DN19971_c0_g1_i1.p1  ORF type:complete len:767 (-),score=124.09 TRINITY_DN19971_c0_g1_i1:82-2382(-)